MLASRPDIVRADYMEELCTLQDDVPSFPDDIVSILLTASPNNILLTQTLANSDGGCRTRFTAHLLAAHLC